jgi:hypothetical protein
LAGWAAALAPLFRRAPTTSTTPTGREGNVAPAAYSKHANDGFDPTKKDGLATSGLALEKTNWATKKAALLRLIQLISDAP